MSERLGDQMTELRSQRAELERSVTRIGQAFAAGADRQALLEVAVDAAVAACDAESGRAILTAGGITKAEAGEAPAVSSWPTPWGKPSNACCARASRPNAPGATRSLSHSPCRVRVPLVGAGAR